jgi:hypothetical protein
MSMMWKEILQQGALNVKQYTWKVGKKFHSETNVPVVCGYESKILSYFQLFVLLVLESYVQGWPPWLLFLRWERGRLTDAAVLNTCLPAS